MKISFSCAPIMHPSTLGPNPIEPMIELLKSCDLVFSVNANFQVSSSGQRCKEVLGDKHVHLQKIRSSRKILDHLLGEKALNGFKLTSEELEVCETVKQSLPKGIPLEIYTVDHFEEPTLKPIILTLPPDED